MLGANAAFLRRHLRTVRVDQQSVRIGVTATGDDARRLVEFHLRQPRGLAHLDRIAPAGHLTINASCSPFGIRGIKQEPEHPHRDAPGRVYFVRSWCANYWVKTRVPASVAVLLEALLRARPGGISTASRRSLSAAGGSLSWTRRTPDLRGLGLPVLVYLTSRSHSTTILHLHGDAVLDDPPDDGLPVVRFRTIAERCMEVTAELVERQTHSRVLRHQGNALARIECTYGPAVATAARVGMQRGLRTATAAVRAGR